MPAAGDGRRTKASGDCDGQNKKTDLYFSYSQRGEVSDVWQSTPNSGGFYHLTASYWANGAVNTLNAQPGGLPGLPTFTYGADGEGRPSAVTASSGTHPLPSGTPVSYNMAGQVTGLTFGSGDADSFGYDANTGRMTKYQFNVGSNSTSGTLSWNANWTLRQNVILDPFNSANQQTCTYRYDDLSRIAGTQQAPGVDCGANRWQQYFTYDAFGNITKNLIFGAGSSFQPTYNLNNQYSLSGASPPIAFDGNGNTTQDNAHAYSWDAEGKMLSVDGSTVALTYDALGRMVEQDRGGTYKQIVYGLNGNKLALMDAQTLTKAFIGLPAGVVAVYSSGGTLSHFRHPDWLGHVRVSSDINHNILSDLAYAPFGETYAEFGTPDRSFTGQEQDTSAGGTAGLYDFLYREYALYGRWTSPDPAGFRAVDPRNPQSWNRYAYALNNPVSLIDRKGLRVAGPHCAWDDGEDDTPENGGAGKDECLAQGGYWVDGDTVTMQAGDTLPWWVLDTYLTPNPLLGAGSGFELYGGPDGARLPSESWSECVDRAQGALLGDTGTNVLNALSVVGPVGAVYTTPTTTPTDMPGVSVTMSNWERDAFFNARAGANNYAFASRATGAASKAFLVITAVATGVKGGFWVACLY